MELFGRSASYDTGEDAIVRVTASDAHKRLLQHYGRDGDTSDYRINLPSGSYIPEVTRVPRADSGLFDGALAHGETGHSRHDSDSWLSLFSNQLDFQFEFEKGSQADFIRNLHPRPDEQSQYVPTAPG